MNRLQALFTPQQKRALSVYYTAGFPNLNSTLPVLQALEAAGASIAEIGMPFSDPVADGTVIQQSNLVSLENGMSLHKLFEQLENMRQTVNLPVILMGYFNPVFRFGVEEFCKACKKVGVDGLILPDLPPEEYLEKYATMFEANGLSMIFLVTPQTSEQRIRYIDQISTSFIYAVSSFATTGNNTDFQEYQIEYFEKLQNLNLKSPILIGFGIHNRQTFETACKYANGAIIGSSFIRHLQKTTTDLNAHVKEFVREIL